MKRTRLAPARPYRSPARWPDWMKLLYTHRVAVRECGLIVLCGWALLVVFRR